MQTAQTGSGGGLAQNISCLYDAVHDNSIQRIRCFRAVTDRCVPYLCVRCGTVYGNRYTVYVLVRGADCAVFEPLITN